LGNGRQTAVIQTLTVKEPAMFNISTRRVGGLRFLKIGRLTFMFCVSREYRSF
jgi:hypothetical protein